MYVRSLGTKYNVVPLQTVVSRLTFHQTFYKNVIDFFVKPFVSLQTVFYLNFLYYEQTHLTILLDLRCVI